MAKTEANNTSLEPILETIDQINTSGFPFNRQCGPVCPAPQDENALLQQCAVDLCGPPNKNPRFIIDNTNFLKDIDPDILNTFSQEIEPAIRAGIKNQRDFYKNALNNLKKTKTALNSDLESPEWDKIWSQIVDRYTTMRFSATNNIFTKIIFKEPNELIAPIIRSSVAEENKLRAEAKAVLESKNQNQIEQFLTGSVQSLISEYEKNKHRLTPIDRRIVEDIAGSLEDKAYWRNMDTVTMQNLYGDISVFSAKMSQPFCSHPSCKKLVTQEMDFQQDRIEVAIENTPDINNTDDSLYINYCKSLFIENTLAMKQTKTYKENFEKYKDKITSTVFAHYSAQSRQQFENYINTIYFDMPHTDTVDYFKDHINEGAVFRNSETKEVQLHVLDNAGKKHKFEVCPPSQFNSKLIDSFSPRENTVKASFLSCAFHDHGKVVLAHELGHVVSYLFNPKNAEQTRTQMSDFSYNKYKKLRECGTNRYKQAPPLDKPDQFLHQNDSLRTEEDTADLIGYLSFPNNPVHAECSLIKPSEDGSKYENLKVLYEPGHSDPHSTGFLRVLMEAIHKRTKLSTACQQVIDRYKDRVNFEPCF